MNVPFEADSVTKRTAAADGGYVSECVTWKQGDTKLLKINFITNGDALPGYGEEFGTENIQPTRTWLDKTGKRVRVVAAGAKVPTGDYWLYAINDSDERKLHHRDRKGAFHRGIRKDTSGGIR